MSGIEVQHYLRRAQDFYDGMLLLRGEENYRYSSALLAIHAAVSYADALRTGLGDENLGADDHQIAARSLRRLLPGNTIKLDNGLRHLEALVANKSAVAYGDKRLGAREYDAILTHADRFTAWANGVGINLRLRGWRDGGN